MENWASVIIKSLPVIGTLGGAFIGSYYTSRSQHKLLKEQIKVERAKELENKEIETLKVYNEILKIDGQTLMVTRLGGPYNEFDVNDYQKEIRPVVYNSFHLLHHDVVNTIRNMDSQISEANYNEEITSLDSDWLATEYFRLIEQIERHIENYRKKNVN